MATSPFTWPICAFWHNVHFKVSLFLYLSMNDQSAQKDVQHCRPKRLCYFVGTHTTVLLPHACLHVITLITLAISCRFMSFSVTFLISSQTGLSRVNLSICPETDRPWSSFVYCWTRCWYEVNNVATIALSTFVILCYGRERADQQRVHGCVEKGSTMSCMCIV